MRALRPRPRDARPGRELQGLAETIGWMRSTRLGIERSEEDERKLVRLDEQVSAMTDNHGKLEARRELLATQEGELKLVRREKGGGGGGVGPDTTRHDTGYSGGSLFSAHDTHAIPHLSCSSHARRSAVTRRSTW